MSRTYVSHYVTPLSLSTLFILAPSWPEFVFVPLSEIRAQLVEQQKCLDQQTEMRVQLLQDLQDFFRKKAEIEMEYSRNLEKLAERFMAKTRSTKDHQQYKYGNIIVYVRGLFMILCEIF